MADQVASNETGATDKIEYGYVSDTFHIYIEFLTIGTVEIQASPDGGDTWLPWEGSDISSSQVIALDSSPSTFRLVAQNGAEFNAWVE